LSQYFEEVLNNHQSAQIKYVHTISVSVSIVPGDLQHLQGSICTTYKIPLSKCKLTVVISTAVTVTDILT